MKEDYFETRLTRLLNDLREQNQFSEFKSVIDDFIDEVRHGSRENLHCALEGLDGVVYDLEIRPEWTFKWLCEFLGDLGEKNYTLDEYAIRHAVYMHMIAPLRLPLPADLTPDFRSLAFLFSFLEVRECQWIFFELYMLEDSEFCTEFHLSRRINLDVVNKSVSVTRSAS